jgi:hypothetical protein
MERRITREATSCATIEELPNFMELEGSLPQLQDPFITGLYPEPYQCSPHYPIVSTHLRLGLASGLFPSGFPMNNIHKFLSSICATCPAYLILFDLIILSDSYTWRRVQIMKFVIMLISPTSYHFICPRSKYYPRHPVLKTFSLHFPLNISYQVSRPYKTTGKII